MVCSLIRKSVAFYVFFLFVLFFSSHHHQQLKIFALRIVSINPQQFDPNTRIVEIPNWPLPDTNSDFSSDSDGGIIYFDGALAENTTLIIRDVVAKRIEINATMSAGCTLIVENCRLFNSSVGQTSGNDPASGGLLISPTIFTSYLADLTLAYSCSKVVFPSTTTSSALKVQVIIRNNIITSFSEVNQLSAPAITSQVSPYFVSPIIVNNLIICKNPNSAPSGVGVSLDLVISNNNISISTSSDYPNGISIYLMHRNRKSLLAGYLNAAAGSAAKDLYDVVVPISSITISNNSISVVSIAASTSLAGGRAIMIGSWTSDGALGALGLFKTNYSYLLLKNDSDVIFDFSSNRIFVDRCIIAYAFFLGDVIGINTLPSPPSALQQPQPRFIINFHSNPIINITSTTRSVGLDLLTMQNFIRYSNEINFFSNYDVRLTQTDPKSSIGGAVSGLRVVQFFSPSNFTNVTVMSCVVSFNGGNSDDKTVVRTQGNGLGQVLIKNVSLTMINDPRFRSYRVNASNRLHSPNFECGFFTNYLVPNIQSFIAEDNEYVDLGNTNNSAILFAFYGYLSSQVMPSLDGSWGVSSMGSVVVRNNRVHSASRTDFGFIYWAVVARVSEVLIENNTIDGEAYLPWVIRKSVTTAAALRFNKCVIRGNSLQFRACDICEVLDSNFEFIFMSYFLLESIKSSSNQIEAIEKNSHFVVENNTVITHGFRTAVFFRGGYMAGGDYLPGRTTVVRNNVVSFFSREQATFLFQPLIVSDPEKFRFGMKNIVVDSNVVSLVSRQAASFWVSSAAPDATSRTVLYVEGTFASDLVAIITNNVVNSTAGVLGFLVGLTNLALNSIVLNNNTFDMAVNTAEPPISPAGIPIAFLSREYRFSVLSDSTLKYFNLTSSTDSTSHTPVCSLLNGVPITSKLVRSFVYQKTNVFLQQLLGRGSLTGDYTVNAGSCQSTRTQSQEQAGHSNNNSSNNTTNATNLPRRRTQTQTSFDANPKKPSPLGQTVSSLSSTATLALGSLAASSSMAATPVRTRAVLLGVDQILSNDCGGSFTVDFLEEAPPLSSSPTQMYFSSSSSPAGAGGGGYASGTIIGNTILILASVIVWILTTFVVENHVIPFMKNRKNLPSNNSRSKNNNDRQSSTLRRKKKYPSLKYVFFTPQGFSQSRAMVPAVNFGLMFLDPMFTSAIALIMIPEVGVGWKVVGVFISIILLLCCFFFIFVIYYLMISRKTVEHFFSMRRYQQFQKLSNGKSIHIFKRLWNFLMEPEGEWRCPKIGTPTSTTNPKQNNTSKNKNIRSNEGRNNKTSSSSNSCVTKHDVILWRLVEPAIDGFTSAFPRFTICDVLIVVALALSSVIGQATQNCTVMGVLMIISVGIHFAIALYFRPDQERLLKVLIPLMGAIQIVLLGVALAGGMENVGAIEPLAVILVILQMMLTALWIISIGLSLVEFTKRSVSFGDASKREGNQSSDIQMMTRKLKGEEKNLHHRRDNENNNRGLLGIPVHSSSSSVSRHEKVKNGASLHAPSSTKMRKGEQDHDKDEHDAERSHQNNNISNSRSGRSGYEKRALPSCNDEFRRSSSSSVNTSKIQNNNNDNKSRERDLQKNSASSSRNGSGENRHSSSSTNNKNQPRKSRRVVDENI